jgi:hypothetical protein
MPEPNPPAILSQQVLADPTGRRRRWLVIAGRVATTALGLWLLVLILGGLGLQPLAGLPVVGELGPRAAAPPALPKRVRSAVDSHTALAPPKPAAHVPVTTVPLRSPRPAVTAPLHARTRSPRRTTPVRTPATAPPRLKTTPGGALTSPAPAPSRSTTRPSSTAPGQSRNPPGQTKHERGPPTTTPGTTPSTNGNHNGAGTGPTGRGTAP